MSKKSQHNNILLAVIGFTAVVILVGIIGFFTLEQKDDTIQGEVEVSEYRESCNDAEQWQEGTHLEDKLNTGLVG